MEELMKTYANKLLIITPDTQFIGKLELDRRTTGPSGNLIPVGNLDLLLLASGFTCKMKQIHMGNDLSSAAEHGRLWVCIVMHSGSSFKMLEVSATLTP